MARRIVPKFLAVSENANRGALVSSVFHAALLGAVIVGAPQLFGRMPKNREVPITIQIFDGVYEDETPPLSPDNDALAAVKSIEAAIQKPTEALPVSPPEPAVAEPPKAAPEIAVPDVRDAAIEAARRAERPADSGPQPDPRQPGDVAMVYERGTPLTPREERPVPAPAAEPLPETIREMDAEIRRLEALKAQAQLRKRVPATEPKQEEDVEERIAALEQRLKRLTVAKAAAQLPKVARPENDRSNTPLSLSETRPSKVAVNRPDRSARSPLESKPRSLPPAEALPEPPLPKLSAIDILKKSERREKASDSLSKEDRERARQAMERFRKAADQGIKSAEMNVARALDKGKGADQDKQKATKILEKLARDNYQPAQIELAKKHLTGDGVKKDKKRAYILLKTAAEENNVVARRALKALNKELSAEDRQLAEKEAGKWRRFIDKQRAENKLTSTRQKKLDDDLRVAIDKGNVQRIETLIRSGADPNAIDASGRDAIIAAAWRGREMVVEFLIDKGVDLDTIDLEGRTPLIWASINGYQSIVEDLLTEGADPNARDDEGRTALMRAAWNGHGDVVKALLENGAIPDAVDGEGKTALDRAREEDWPQVVRVLEGFPKAN